MPYGESLVYFRRYSPNPDCDEDAIVLYHFDTGVHQLLTELDCPKDYLSSEFSFSPDGTLLLWNEKTSTGSTAYKSDIFIMDIRGGNRRRLTDHPSDNRYAVFRLAVLAP